jgi:nucleotide-binding universal stress UspA family protein
MRKILIPTDFSPNAWNAIRYALEFFEEETVAFYLLHTYTPAFYRMDYMLGGPAFSAIPDVGVDISLAGLEKTLNDIQKQFSNPKHSFETVSAFNLLTDEINELAQQKGIEMVVMGTKGATGAKQFFLGSNTIFVIRKARIPVLAIPEKCRYHKVVNILFPTGYWSRYKIVELRTLLGIAKMNEAKITVFHVKEEHDLTEQQENNKIHLKKCLKKIQYQFTEVHGKLMPHAILDHIEGNDFQLLAMMNRGHSFFERVFIKQNIDQIGFHVQIPFLVIPDTSKVNH